MASGTNEIETDGEETVATREATETEMAKNVAGTLSYLVGLVTGIIFYVIDDREFVRFHAAQSIVFTGLLLVAYILLSIVQTVLTAVLFSGGTGAFIIGSVISLVFLLVWLVLGVGGFGAWLYMMYKAYNGTTPRIPLVAGIADRLM